MIRFEKVVLSHANLKRPVHIVAGTIAGYHWSEASKATHVYTTGGIFPVEETPEQIDTKLETLNLKGGN